MLLKIVIVSLTLLSLNFTVSAQRKAEVPDKFLKDVQTKTAKMERRVTRSTDKLLSRLEELESRMRARLASVDSLAAERIFDRPIDSLAALKASLRTKTGHIAKVFNNGAYNGYLDTVTNALSFLKNSKQLLSKSKDLEQKLGRSLQSVADLQARLQSAEQIKAYLRHRRQELQRQLSQYNFLSKDLKKINKQAYYYAQQVREYREILHDRSKAEAKALELLQKSAAFTRFMEQHSSLAGLFNFNSAAATGGDLGQSLAGLQTRDQVERLIGERLGSGPNVNNNVGQQMEAAQAQFEELKKNFPDADNAAEMPDFKPNEMNTKSFIQRLEFGGNVQFQRSQRYFPTTGDITGQVAYKFHSKASAGLGVAYKIGLGSGWDNIAFSHQGIGFRSFVDWKMKYGLYINGGFEQNYNKPFGNIADLKNYSPWSGSGLIGISKKYKISPKLKGTAILLYDFLANRQIPAGTPLKVRIGYAL